METRQHTPMIADGNAPLTCGKFVMRGFGTDDEWAAQTPVFQDLGRDRRMMVENTQQMLSLFDDDILLAALDADLTKTVFFGPQVFVINRDGTRSAEITAELHDVNAMILWAFKRVAAD